jgi:hypothetical protein
MAEEAKVPDSIISAADRHRMIREQSDRIEAEKDEQERIRTEREKKTDEKARDQEVRFLEQVALVSSNETIEHLHERIRALRAPPPDPEKNRPPPFLTERQAAQIAAEQEGGRLASERARIREEANRAAAAKYEAEQKIKEGYQDPMVLPNPLQSEVFPAVKATLK